MTHDFLVNEFRRCRAIRGQLSRLVSAAANVRLRTIDEGSMLFCRCVSRNLYALRARLFIRYQHANYEIYVSICDMDNIQRLFRLIYRVERIRYFA